MLDKIILKGKEVQMTDEEFFSFCQSNPELNIERNSKREIIIMSPTGSKSGIYHVKIVTQLEIWNEQHKPGVVFDSSTGFTLSDDSVRSPDASWVSCEKWNGLSEEEKEKFAPVCPEFIIELKSKHDKIRDLQAKMESWIQNGVQLGWLIDPDEQKVYVYQPQQEVKVVPGFQRELTGDLVLPGFAFDLRKLL